MTSIAKITLAFYCILDIDYKQLTYSFGGIVAVLIVLLILAGAIIKTMTLKCNRKYLHIIYICGKCC